MIIRLIKATVGSLEYDAKTQYKFHLAATWFWFATLLVLPFIIHPHSGEQWVSLIILEVSLYANFATEFGAMSAAIAASQDPPGTVVTGRPAFANPNYKPPKMESLGLGWDEAESNDWLDRLAADKEDEDVANF